MELRIRMNKDRRKQTYKTCFNQILRWWRQYDQTSLTTKTSSWER